MDKSILTISGSLSDTRPTRAFQRHVFVQMLRTIAHNSLSGLFSYAAVQKQGPLSLVAASSLSCFETHLASIYSFVATII